MTEQPRASELTKTEIVRNYAPSEEPWPELPTYSEEGWEFRTVSKRTCPGRTGETLLCPATGEQIPVTKPHICVVARRDQFPDVNSPTAEYKRFAFPDKETLRQWFEEGSADVDVGVH